MPHFFFSNLPILSLPECSGDAVEKFSIGGITITAYSTLKLGPSLLLKLVKEDFLHSC